MDCEICLLDWNLNDRIPKILNCGHSICKLCVIDIYNTNKLNSDKLKCPFCKYDLNHVIKEINDIDNLTDNLTLINIVKVANNQRQLIENCK